MSATSLGRRILLSDTGRRRNPVAALIGWRTPQTKADKAHWVIVAVLTIGTVVVVAGPPVLHLALPLAVIATAVLLIRRAPVLTAVLAVGTLAAVPALLGIFVFDWDVQPRLGASTTWLVLSSALPILTGTWSARNPIRIAALVAAPLVAGTASTLALGVESMAAIGPLAVCVALAIGLSTALKDGRLPDDTVAGSEQWRSWGEIAVKDSAGTHAEAISDGRWLGLVWPVTSSKALASRAEKAVARAHDAASRIGVKPQNIQVILLRKGSRPIERIETAGGVVAVVGQTSLPELLAALPRRRRLSLAARQRVNRLHIPGGHHDRES